MLATHLHRLVVAATFLAAGPAFGATPSVCDRTPQIRDYLVDTLGKACDDITDADLLQVDAVRVPNTGLTAVQVGDFNGLARLETMNLKRNKLESLPVGIFAPLVSLRVLVILGNDLHGLPDDFTIDNPKLEKIHMFNNAFTTLSPQVLRNLEALPKLNVLDIGKELDDATHAALWAAFPRENEHVTLIFD